MGRRWFLASFEAKKEPETKWYYIVPVILQTYHAHTHKKKATYICALSERALSWLARGGLDVAFAPLTVAKIQGTVMSMENKLAQSIGFSVITARNGKLVRTISKTRQACLPLFVYA